MGRDRAVQQTVATVSVCKAGWEGEGVGGEEGSTAGDLPWEKQLCLKLVGERDLSHSSSTT